MGSCSVHRTVPSKIMVAKVASPSIQGSRVDICSKIRQWRRLPRSLVRFIALYLRKSWWRRLLRHHDFRRYSPMNRTRRLGNLRHRRILEHMSILEPWIDGEATFATMIFEGTVL